tara:strand:+ start:3465 stop:4193 length:729 start_codon:yes stop_codon:yes gene_type:complete
LNWKFSLGDNASKNKISVGILWFGEYQIFSLLRRLHRISKFGYFFDLKIIGFKNNLIAHQELYEFFNTSSFVKIKIDGDMTLLSDDIFLEKLRENPDDEVRIYPVFDFITNMQIMGVHIFGKNVILGIPKDSLFPDNYIAENIIIRHEIFLSHCKNPSVSQISNFIGHRLKKLLGSKKNKRSYLKIIFIAFAKNWKIMPLILYNVLKLFFRKNYKVISESNKNLHQKELNKFIKFNLKINQN